jgi:hypothetical protein
MTVAMGGDVAHMATGDSPRPETGWQARLVPAFGGAVLAVCLVILGAVWSQGLRAATFEDLRNDLASGGVREWYVADELVKGDFDRLYARQAPWETTEVTDDGVTSGTTTGSDGEASGGLIVWQSRDEVWHVAAADVDLRSSAGYSGSASPQSAELVAALREAGAPMRAFDFGDPPGWHTLAKLGGLVVLLVLVSGAAPRVGTRWFWFWMLLNAPLLLGFVAYAVLELIGIRRRRDPPLGKRLPGLASFVGAPVLSVLVVLGAGYLRQQGVPIPL